MTAPIPIRQRVAICTPCQDSVNSGFAYDLARLVAQASISGTEVVLFQNRGTIIPQQRATLARAAKQAECTHVLWLDSDMRFPPDTLARLLQHHRPIVAANYPTRRPPILPTAEHRDLGLLFTESDSEGLVEVSHAGMGVMVVDAAVYATIPEPWFALGFNKQDGEYVGEDFFFCKRAKEHGFATLIDQALSREVRHVGEMEFKAEHANLTRDAYNAKHPKPQLVP